MAGFTSYDDLISEISVNGKLYEWNFFKQTPGASEAAGTWTTYWQGTGSPGAGANPATTPGTAHDDTAGGIIFPDQASDQKHLLTFGAAATNACNLMLYDRLCSVSGISVASTGDKTVNSVALPRYTGTDAAGVQVWLEVTTATTVTAPIVSLNSYTNEAGTAGRAGATVTFPAAATNIYSMIGPMPLQGADKGVRSVEVGLNVATAATAGVVNVVLLRPLATLACVPNAWCSRDFALQTPSLPRIYDGATLALMFQGVAAQATNVWGTVRVAYG